MSLRKKFAQIVDEAIRTGERRLVVLSGKESVEKAAELVNLYLKKKPKATVLFVGWMLEETGEILELGRFVRKLKKGEALTAVDYTRTEEVMGGTWDILVMDLTHQLKPNDLGRTVEVVRGGGLVIFTMPSVDVWMRTITFFQRRLLTYPYQDVDLKQRFKARFLRKVKEHEGTWIIDVDSKEVLGKPRKVAKKKLKPVKGDGVKSLALTEDQYDVLVEFEKIESLDERKAIVITANRGRGKSAAVGLGLSILIAKMLKKKRKIAVTAPELTGVQVLFEFLRKGLEHQGIKYKLLLKDKKVKELRVKDIYVFYVDPMRIGEVKASIKVVDEAASVPVPILHQVVETAKLSIFSSTIHGYEGAGRGFSVRFLAYLKEDAELDVAHLTMSTPIRYPPDDPIEKWLYDVLLLDAEPASITDEDVELVEEGRFKYVEVDLDEWSTEREDLLRQFYGIYVLAHYRNRPDDLETLLDAPHHRARAVVLENGKVVVAIQIAEEGSLPDSIIEKMVKRIEEPHGHMIPNRVALHHGLKFFAKLKGYRVVRIATHPKLWRKGLGSRALEYVYEEAKSKGLDWVGAGFGASADLCRFWIKNGYIPVHMSPAKNPVSGEYSVLMVRPITRRARRLVVKANSEFKNRLVNALHDVYFELEPEIARVILKLGFKDTTPSITRGQMVRLIGYVKGDLSYESCSDVIYELVKCYFMESPAAKPKLEPEQEEMLIAKVLQGKSWRVVKFKLGIEHPFDEMRKVIKVIAKYFEHKIKRKFSKEYKRAYKEWWRRQ